MKFLGHRFTLSRNGVLILGIPSVGISLTAMVLFPLSMHSQDIHSSQFIHAPILMNPATTGMFDGKFRAVIDYKNQWASMGNPYRTMFAAYDMPVLKGKKKLGHFGAGAYFYSDKTGDARLGTTTANLCISAIVPLNKNNGLSAGFQFGYSHRGANISDLQWPSQYNGQSYDPSIVVSQANLFSPSNYFDMATGVQYQFLKAKGNTQGKDIFKIDFGVAYFHLTTPDQNFFSVSSDPLYGKAVLNASVRYDIPETQIGIVPFGIYMVQGPATEINVGILLRRRITEGTKLTGFKTESAVSGGLGYRGNDAIIPQLLLEYANFNFGISYDINISSLSRATRKAGGLEILLKYSLINEGSLQLKK